MQSRSNQIPTQCNQIHHEPGSRRRPKNKHDLTVFSALPNTVKMASASASSSSDDDEKKEKEIAAAVRAVPVPGVPGAVMVCGVVTPEECGQIRGLAEAMGCTPGEAVGRHGGGAPR